MSVLTTVPLTIEPEAAARITELGMQAEFDQMLEHTRQVVPNLERIEVKLEPSYDTGDDLGITIEGMLTGPCDGDDLKSWEWGQWKAATFSPDVCRYFGLLLFYGTPDAR